jgi:hypothetical protein
MSYVPPAKRRKKAKTNVLSGVTGYAALGINFNEENDEVIQNIVKVSTDGRRVNTMSTTIPRFRERVFNSIEPLPDWDTSYGWDDVPSKKSDAFSYQVKKGRVTKVRRKLYASVSPFAPLLCSAIEECRTDQCKFSSNTETST